MNQNFPSLYTLKECRTVLKIGRHWRISEHAIHELYVFSSHLKFKKYTEQIIK